MSMSAWKGSMSMSTWKATFIRRKSRIPGLINASQLEHSANWA
jgi:hypothetical protein